MGPRGCGGDSGDEKHAMERVEELPRYRLIRGKVRCGRSGRRRLLRPDKATLEGNPRVTPRGRRLPEAAREGAPAAGVGRGRGDAHAGGWGVQRRGRLADGGGDHGDELQRVWLCPFGDWNLSWGFLCIWAGLFNFIFSAFKK